MSLITSEDIQRLAEHQRRFGHLGNKSGLKKEASIRCEKCDWRFKSKVKLKKHLATVHAY